MDRNNQRKRKKEENKKGKTFDSYKADFEYLMASGIALGVKAVSTPVFPLVQSSDKNLLKLYLNDPGILSSVLYGNNIQAILNDQCSVNLGSIYETAAAAELAAHGVNVVIYANQLTRAAFPAMQSVAEDLLRHHRALEVDARLMPFKKIITLIDA